MANVIGIPLIKGNSEAIITGRVRGDAQTALEATKGALEGLFVGITGANREKNTYLLSDAGIPPAHRLALAMDFSKCSTMGSLVRSVEQVTVPVGTSGAGSFAVGDALTIDPDTGLADPDGSIITNGEIVGTGNITGINGKTGAKIAGCVDVSFAALRDVTPPAPPAP